MALLPHFSTASLEKSKTGTKKASIKQKLIGAFFRQAKLYLCCGYARYLKNRKHGKLNTE